MSRPQPHRLFFSWEPSTEGEASRQRRTRLIDEYATDHANWADDVVGRALGNRGNARARQVLARCRGGGEGAGDEGQAFRTRADERGKGAGPLREGSGGRAEEQGGRVFAELASRGSGRDGWRRRFSTTTQPSKDVLGQSILSSTGEHCPCAEAGQPRTLSPPVSFSPPLRCRHRLPPLCLPLLISPPAVCLSSQCFPCDSLIFSPFCNGDVAANLRGVALETMGRYEEARRDYLAVLEAEPSDAAAWNNLGNVEAASLNWEGAFRCYDKAAQLVRLHLWPPQGRSTAEADPKGGTRVGGEKGGGRIGTRGLEGPNHMAHSAHIVALQAPQFSFAAANRALARFEMGEEDLAIRDMRALLRRYPEFPDVRAALTAALWRVGKEGEAESNWCAPKECRGRGCKAPEDARLPPSSPPPPLFLRRCTFPLHFFTSCIDRLNPFQHADGRDSQGACERCQVQRPYVADLRETLATVPCPLPFCLPQH